MAETRSYPPWPDRMVIHVATDIIVNHRSAPHRSLSRSNTRAIRRINTPAAMPSKGQWFRRTWTYSGCFSWERNDEKPTIPESLLDDFGVLDHADPVAADELAFDRDCLGGDVGQRRIDGFMFAD